MKDATPNPRPRTATKYEVAAVHPASGRSAVMGFTARTTKLGLLAVMRQRGEELIELTGLGHTEPIDFEKDGAGRWTARIGRTGWVVKFTGRTERHVAAVNAEEEGRATG